MEIKTCASIRILHVLILRFTLSILLSFQTIINQQVEQHASGIFRYLSVAISSRGPKESDDVAILTPGRKAKTIPITNGSITWQEFIFPFCTVCFLCLPVLSIHNTEAGSAQVICRSSPGRSTWKTEVRRDVTTSSSSPSSCLGCRPRTQSKRYSARNVQTLDKKQECGNNGKLENPCNSLPFIANCRERKRNLFVLCSFLVNGRKFYLKVRNTSSCDTCGKRYQVAVDVRVLIILLN